MATTAATADSAAAGMAPALKDALLAAFVTFVLLAPMLGMRTASGPDGMTLEFHFEWVFLLTAIVFAGRLALGWLGTAKGALTTPPALIKLGDAIAARSWWFAAAGLVFALVLPFMPFANRYVVDIATTVLIYVMLGWGLNIVVGLAGLLDLGYVAFYAVGAYSYALFAHTFGLGFWTCLPLAGLLAATFGVMLGFPGAAPAWRLSGHRHAWLRRDHPHRPAQLVRGHRRPERPVRHPAPQLLRLRVRPHPRGGHHAVPRVVRARIRQPAPDHLSLLPDPGAWR